MRNEKNSVSKYAIGSTAVISAMASAHAGITYRDVQDVTASNTGGVILSFNLAGDVMTNAAVANEQFRLRNAIKESGGPEGYNDLWASAVGPTAAARFDRTPLSLGTAIGAGQTIDPANQTGILDGNKPNGSPDDQGPWTVGQRAYVGIKFDAGGQPNYGWADIRINSYQSATLYSFAYDDTGGPIQAGVVPEPSQIALLAMGAAGVLGLRSRNRMRAR